MLLFFSFFMVFKSFGGWIPFICWSVCSFYFLKLYLLHLFSLCVLGGRWSRVPWHVHGDTCGKWVPLFLLVGPGDQTRLSDFIVIFNVPSQLSSSWTFCGVGRDRFNIPFTPCKKPLKTLTAVCFIWITYGALCLYILQVGTVKTVGSYSSNISS